MKQFFITLVVASLATIGYGQTAIGVKGNDPLLTFNVFANVKSGGNYNVEYFPELILPNVGVFANVRFASHFAFQPELMYKQEAISFQRENENLERGDRHFIRFNSIEMPMLLHIQGNNPFRGFGQIGVAPKFLMRATYSERQKSARTDISRYFNSTQLVFHLGGGVMWETRKWIFMADGRFSGSISDISSDSYNPYLDFKDATSVYLSFSVGVGYKIR